MNFFLLSRPIQNTRAMTLVEILIGVVIMSILIGLLFPAATEFVQRSKDAKCLSNHQSISQAMMMYIADNDGTLPGNETDSLTAGKLSPYLDIEWSKNPRWTSMWLCPAQPVGFGKHPFPTYAFTQELFGLRVKPPHAAEPEGRMTVQMATINQPSKSAAFACIIYQYALFHVYAYTHTADPPNPSTDLAQLAPWHGGGTAITFMDGHSELVGAFPKTDKRRNWFSRNNSNVP